MTKSPRFRFRFNTLRPHLNKDKLKSIWKDHIRAANRNQVLYDLTDYYDIHHDIDEHIEDAVRLISSGLYKPSSPVRVSLEKSKGLCRHIVIPGPVDSLILQAIVNAIMTNLLRGAPGKKAYYQPQSHQFNRTRAFRLKEAEYGSLSSWLSFQKEIFKFARTYKYVAVTDIANFFDTVDFSQLKSVISATDGVEEVIIDMILYILESYSWRPDYMPQAMCGLPQMNFDAPRLLAHSMLFELDNYLVNQSNVDYVRFMDDIDVGVDDRGTAKKILRNIDNVLHTRGLRLNTGKTKIMSGEEAISYYFINDNWKLDTVEGLIETKRKRLGNAFTIAHISREITFISSKFNRDYNKSGYFEKGNGEKVLKRYLTYAQKFSISLPDNALREFVYEHPSLRDMACYYISFYGYTDSKFAILDDYVRSNHCVDGASNYLIAKTLVDMNCPRRKSVLQAIRQIGEIIAARGPTGLASATWLLSKYGTQKQLMWLIEEFFDIWSTSDWLGRQVGALYPRFRANKPIFLRFRELIRRSRNPGALSVFSFHSRIMRNSVMMPNLRQYLMAPSPSLPRGISHQKILILMSVLRGNAPPQTKATLAATYRGFDLDPIQRSLLRRLV